MKTRSPVTTHILDVSLGKPAVGIPVSLERMNGEAWVSVASSSTDADGRVEGWIPVGTELPKAVYRLNFKIGKVSSFYPEISICFNLENPAQHYHIPLLLSPFGYSTYRGT
jgi:5-hydroxyisourate hydrolase